MLRKISARNFQCHAKLDIDLDRITTFVGVSDSGKSALLRMIGWVAFNQPVGDEMVRQGAPSAIGKLVFDDCTVIRTKGKGRNSYTLDGKIQKAFGAGKVPDLVAAAMRLDSINFQWQFDGHFWFADTAGKVSQELNRIVDLSVIDSSLAAANADLKKAKATREVCEERLEAARKEAASLAWVPDMVRDLDSITTVQKHIEESREAGDLLEEVLGSIEEAENRGKEASERAEVALALSKRLEAHCRVTQERESLSELFDRLAELEKVAAKGVPDLSGTEKRLLEANRLRDEGNSLEELLDRLDELEEELCQRRKTSTQAARDLAEASQGLCPICGTEMSRS